jgi:hypothetical protein
MNALQHLKHSSLHEYRQADDCKKIPFGIVMIKAQKYTFHCRFTSEARLPGYLGSTLRGALGWALKKTSCALRRQQCAGCLLREQCAYAWIFETEQYRIGDGRTVNARPHPFVLQPGKKAKSLQPGQVISFSLLLFDRAVEMLPQLVYAVKLMGESGIGNGRRFNLGRFDLERVTSAEKTVYSNEQEILHTAGTPGHIALKDSGSTAIESLKISLHTPLRLKQNNKLGKTLPFHVLIRACLRRITALEDAYGGGEPDLDYRGLVQRAGQVTVSDSSIRWQKLSRWSNRQKREVSLSGLAGSITCQGELKEFLPILRYGQQVNIGKQTVFGLGKTEVDILL